MVGKETSEDALAYSNQVAKWCCFASTSSRNTSSGCARRSSRSSRTRRTPPGGSRRHRFARQLKLQEFQVLQAASKVRSGLHLKKRKQGAFRAVGDLLIWAWGVGDCRGATWSRNFSCAAFERVQQESHTITLRQQHAVSG